MNEYCIYFLEKFNYLTEIEQLIDNKIPIELLISIPVLMTTILITLAIFLGNKQNQSFPWDNLVIFNYIIKFKFFLFAVILFVLIPILWNILNIKIILLSVFIFIVFCLIRVVFDLYKWLIVIDESNYNKKNYRNIIRAKFLKSLSIYQKNIIWSLTWKMDAKERNIIDEFFLVKTFLKDSELLDVNLLKDFTNHLNSINISNQDIHRELIKFCFNNNCFIDQKNEQVDLSQSEFRHIVDNIYEKIIQYDADKASGAISIFSDTKLFLKKIKNNINRINFISNFIYYILNDLKEEDIKKLLKFFPEEWQITSNNLNNSTSKEICLKILEIYMEWIFINTNNKKISADIIDEVTKKIIPNIDPISWSDIVCFLPYANMDYSNGNKLKKYNFIIINYLESKNLFKLSPQSYSFFPNEFANIRKVITTDFKNRTKETIDIVIKSDLFSSLNNKNEIQYYINEIKTIKKDQEFKNNKKLIRLEIFFTKIKMQICENQ